MNSVSLNRSIEAAYKLSIYTLGSCILPCCVSFKDFCCFLSIMLAILFTFSFLNAYEQNMEILLGFEMEKTGETWNTEQKISPKYWVTS